MKHRIVTLTLSLGLLLLFASAAMAQSYHSINLVSNLNGWGKTTTDPLLANPWGLVYAPGSPFWISDEASHAHENPRSLSDRCRGKNHSHRGAGQFGAGVCAGSAES